MQLTSITMTWMKDQWALRINLFHLSSHFGDDYIFRNDIEDYTPESLTYEQGNPSMADLVIESVQ